MLGRGDYKLSINDKTFDQLDLSLFRNYRFFTLIKYIFVLWGLTILKVAFLAADIYTCVKLLVFNSWSNSIFDHYIPSKVRKWLFVASLLTSFVLVAIEVLNGIRIYRTNNISLTYVNNFARTVFSIKSYQIFCVYNRVTPKSFFQKVAFFTFFELKDCVMLLLADTPRQVLSGLTLWSALITVHQDSNFGDIEGFQNIIERIKRISYNNHQEAVLLCTMLISFAIWAFFMVKLACAFILSIFVYYKLFDKASKGGLKQYVCITVSKRVDYLVKKYKAKRFLKQYLAHDELPLFKDDLNSLTKEYDNTLKRKYEGITPVQSRASSETTVKQESIRMPKYWLPNEMEKAPLYFGSETVSSSRMVSVESIPCLPAETGFVQPFASTEERGYPKSRRGWVSKHQMSSQDLLDGSITANSAQEVNDSLSLSQNSNPSRFAYPPRTIRKAATAGSLPVASRLNPSVASSDGYHTPYRPQLNLMVSEQSLSRPSRIRQPPAYSFPSQDSLDSIPSYYGGTEGVSGSNNTHNLSNQSVSSIKQLPRNETPYPCMDGQQLTFAGLEQQQELRNRIDSPDKLYTAEFRTKISEGQWEQNYQQGVDEQRAYPGYDRF